MTRNYTLQKYGNITFLKVVILLGTILFVILLYMVIMTCL